MSTRRRVAWLILVAALIALGSLVVTRQEAPTAREVLWELGPEYGIQPVENVEIEGQLIPLMRVVHNENQTPELRGWRLVVRVAGEEERSGREIARGTWTHTYGSSQTRTLYVLEVEPRSIRARVGDLVQQALR